MKKPEAGSKSKRIYRIVNDVGANVGQISNSDLQGVFGGLVLRFGGFAAASRNDFD